MGFILLPSGKASHETWDHMLADCHNENPYAYSEWLNLVSPGWKAWVDYDRHLLLPLPEKYRWGIKYLSQPLFTQQLGLFSKSLVSPELMNEAFHFIWNRYQRIYLQGNTDNIASEPSFAQRTTYTLNLHLRDNAPLSGYSENHRRNTQKAIRLASDGLWNIEQSEDFKSFAALFMEHTGTRDPGLNRVEPVFLERLLRYQRGHILLCHDAQGVTLAGIYWLKSRTRMVNLFNFTTAKGREDRAMYLLMHTLIQWHTGQDLVLDFEGSEVPSIARFYSGFGGTPTPYPVIHRKLLGLF